MIHPKLFDFIHKNWKLDPVATKIIKLYREAVVPRSREPHVLPQQREGAFPTQRIWSKDDPLRLKPIAISLIRLTVPTNPSVLLEKVTQNRAAASPDVKHYHSAKPKVRRKGPHKPPHHAICNLR
jgi:hypothetical protein